MTSIDNQQEPNFFFLDPTNNPAIRNRNRSRFSLHFVLIPLQTLPLSAGPPTPAHLVGLSEEGVPGAALVDDVPDQVLLAVVGGEHADAVGGVAQQAHVHEESHRVLCLRQVL